MSTKNTKSAKKPLNFGILSEIKVPSLHNRYYFLCLLWTFLYIELRIYLESLGFRSIARLLNCSHIAVYQWINQYGEKANLDQKSTEIDVVEMDEMHSYVGSKKRVLVVDSR